jgi:V/A-type H+/Na+-transporting ATPase subunit E
MKDLAETVLGKIRIEAQTLLRKAEEEARHSLDQARKSHQVEAEKEKRRLLSQAETEAARIKAHAVMEGRNRIAAAKAEVIAKIRQRAQAELDRIPVDPGCLKTLIAEAIAALGHPSQVTVLVRAEDLETARTVVEGDASLAEVVRDIVERPLAGGVITENADGSLRVDNTFPTRLGRLLPRLLPRFRKDLFHET